MSEVQAGEYAAKPHIRLHVTHGGWWWAERYRDCKHGWDCSPERASPADAIRSIEAGQYINRRGFLAQWPNQIQGVRP